MQQKILFLSLIMVANFSMAFTRAVHIQQAAGNCWLRPSTNCDDQVFGTPTDLFSRAHLQLSQFKKAQFLGVAGDGFDMTGINLDKANFEEAVLNYVDLSGCHLRHTDFSKIKATHLMLNAVKDARAVNFSKSTQMEDVSFQGSEFIQADFSEVTGKRWEAGSHVKFWASDFTRANLDTMNFEYADFSGSKFVNATLKDVNFKHANLKNINFESAEISGNSSFEGADMENAVLRCATFSGTVKLKDAALVHIDVMGADLSGTDLSQAFLESIEANYCQTKLPGGQILTTTTQKCERFKKTGCQSSAP